MHGKWDFLLFGIDNSSRRTTHDDFHNNYIKAIMTVREIHDKIHDNSERSLASLARAYYKLSECF